MVAFEKVWLYRKEIVEAWENTGNKKEAVKRGCELSGIAEKTVSAYITSFRFLCAEFAEMERKNEELAVRPDQSETEERIRIEAEDNARLRERIRNLEKAHQAALQELDRERQKGAEDMTQKEKDEIFARLEALEQALSRPEKEPAKAKPKAPVQKVGAWTVTTQGIYYKLTRNFGKKADGKKDVKNLHLGKEFSESAAHEKILKSGFPID